jgi:hypothetical protein
LKAYEFQITTETMVLTAVNSEESSGHPISTNFKGQSKREEWWPIKIDTLYRNKYTDFPHFIIGQPMVSDKVKQILEPYKKDEVEFLPIAHDEMDMYMVNVMNILDCVDWERSEVKWFEEEYFMGFNKLRFDFKKIPDHVYMFKIKETAATEVFVTETFRELIEHNHLQGLSFSVVYDSEFTDDKELEQQQNYEAALLAIEDSKGAEFTYEEAEKRVDQNKAVASGEWKMQLDDKGKFWLGDLKLDLTYQWVRPLYIPPVLFGYQWHEVEKSDL